MRRGWSRQWGRQARVGRWKRGESRACNASPLNLNHYSWFNGMEVGGLTIKRL